MKRTLRIPRRQRAKNRALAKSMRALKRALRRAGESSNACALQSATPKTWARFEKNTKLAVRHFRNAKTLRLAGANDSPLAPGIRTNWPY